jgi:hypothetical protein
MKLNYVENTFWFTAFYTFHATDLLYVKDVCIIVDPGFYRQRQDNVTVILVDKGKFTVSKSFYWQLTQYMFLDFLYVIT